MHVVLLGDSIFDNAAYVGGGPDVIRQLRARLPSGATATLCAVDGAVTTSVARQLERVPSDATHLVVSIGGNDALRHAGVLEERLVSMAEALNRLACIGETFERDYAAMLEGVLRRGLPTGLFTIYEPRFPDPVRRRLAATALTVPNDRIIRAAVAHGLPLIELRLVCDRDEDFANPIEPSTIGGEKIAAAIKGLVTTHDFASRRSEILGR